MTCIDSLMKPSRRSQVDSTTPAAEAAFPQLANPLVTTYNVQATVRANYLPMDTAPIDAAAPVELPSLSAGELLARQLYYLMFRLILDPDVDPTDATQELVPNFPYPVGMTTAAADVEHFAIDTSRNAWRSGRSMPSTFAIPTRS